MGSPGCVHGVVQTLAPCTGEAHPDGRLPLLQRAHAQLGQGSPATAGLISWEAETRARALAAEGRARDAFRLLTLTLTDVDASVIPERVPPFEIPPSDVSPDTMGSAQRNLLLAAGIAHTARQPALAHALRTQAEDAPR